VVVPVVVGAVALGVVGRREHRAFVPVRRVQAEEALHLLRHLTSAGMSGQSDRDSTPPPTWAGL